MSKTVKLRRRRIALWHAQEGKCYWCHCDTVLVEPVAKRKEQPHNMATLDHLRSRFDPTRREKPKRGEQRLVMACQECNHRRGAEEIASRSIEQRRIDCGRHPLSTRLMMDDVESSHGVR
jgi:hypothetical protein